MPISDRLLGVVIALAYGLERTKIGFLRLRVGVMVLSCLCAVYAAYLGWRAGFAPVHGTAIALCLLTSVVFLWAHQRHYMIFHEQPVPAASDVPGLRAEERLHVRGSGLFQVSDMTRYLVEVPTVFWTTRLADHILAAKVRALNILGVGIPSEERGWWYIFIEPKHVLAITAGQLCFGLGVRPAVCVQYKAQKGRQVAYLSCDSPEQRARLLEHLARAQVAHNGAHRN